jgi:hypothetical protein
MSHNVPAMSSAEYQEHILGIEEMSEDAIGTAIDKARDADKDKPKRPRIALDVWKGVDHFYVRGYYRKDDFGAGWIDDMQIELIDQANQAHDITELAERVRYYGSSYTLEGEILTLALEIHEEGK